MNSSNTLKNRCEDPAKTKGSPFAAALFLALPINQTLSKKLKQVDAALLSTYVKEGELYLQDFLVSKERYLGKKIHGIVDLPTLQQLEQNILSLLNKLLPDHSFDENALILLAIPA